MNSYLLKRCLVILSTCHFAKHKIVPAGTDNTNVRIMDYGSEIGSFLQDLWPAVATSTSPTAELLMASISEMGRRNWNNS
jgi:hypothetical protein